MTLICSVGNYKFRVEILVLISVMFTVVAIYSYFPCTNCTIYKNGVPIQGSVKEGLITRANYYTSSAAEYSTGLNATETPSMDFFNDTPFRPDCCPSDYSNGNGCACLTPEQKYALKTRGGNNVPYSNY